MKTFLLLFCEKLFLFPPPLFSPFLQQILRSKNTNMGWNTHIHIHTHIHNSQLLFFLSPPNVFNNWDWARINPGARRQKSGNLSYIEPSYWLHQCWWWVCAVGMWSQKTDLCIKSRSFDVEERYRCLGSWAKPLRLRFPRASIINMLSISALAFVLSIAVLHSF